MLRRSCLARLPKTKSMASMTLDLPLPFGPTTEENLCQKRPRAITQATVGGPRTRAGRCVATARTPRPAKCTCTLRGARVPFARTRSVARVPALHAAGPAPTPARQQGSAAHRAAGAQASRRAADHAARRNTAGNRRRWRGASSARVLRPALTLWKGPICCTPAYDLKFSSVMCVMMRRVRGALAPAAPSDEDGAAIIVHAVVECRRTQPLPPQPLPPPPLVRFEWLRPGREKTKISVFVYA